jgi:hypothetical protein
MFVSKFGRFLLAFIAALFMTGCNDKDNQLIPRDVLFARPERSCVTMSPTGNRIAYIGVDGLYVEDVSRKQLIRKFEGCYGFYDWAQTGEHLITVRNSTGDDNTHVFCLDIKTGSSKDLTPFPGSKSEIAKISDQHPFEIVILSNKDDPLWFSAYKINIITGETKLIFKNTEYINFSFDNDLKPRIGFKVTKNGNCGAYLLDGKKPKFLKYVTLEGSNKTKAFSHFAPDNNTVYGIEFIGGDKKVLTECNLKKSTVRVLDLLRKLQKSALGVSVRCSDARVLPCTLRSCAPLFLPIFRFLKLFILLKVDMFFQKISHVFTFAEGLLSTQPNYIFICFVSRGFRPQKRLTPGRAHL